MDDFAQHPPSITELRADRADDASVWTPRDALIQTLRRLDSGEIAPTSIVVCWTARTDTGAWRSGYTVASPDLMHTVGLLEMSKAQIIEQGG